MERKDSGTPESTNVNEEKRTTCWGHTGDLGDIVAALPAIRSGHNGRLFISFKPDGQREGMRGERFDSIKPLIEVQPYVESVEWVERFPEGTKDFSTFRETYQIHGNLAVQQARHVGTEISLEPWLSIPNPVNHGKVIIARSARYFNPLFPWRRIVGSYQERAFVGLSLEYKMFTDIYGYLEFLDTENLLELAQIIAGAKLVISNQTCAWWIAAGLGVPCIQETYLSDMNSVIDRPNLRYTRTVGEVNQLLESLIAHDAPRPCETGH